MLNLIQARFIPRLGLATGVFLLWAVIYLSVAETHASPAENLVMVPVMLAAILFGMRGGLTGVLVAVLGISTLGVFAGVAPFTRLLHGSAPFDIVMMTSVSLMVGYGRYSQTSKIAATRRAESTTLQLDLRDNEAHILTTLAGDVGKLLTTQSILAAPGEAISQIVEFDRMAIYQVDPARVTVKIVYVSGDKSSGALAGSTYRLTEIMAVDPFDNQLDMDREYVSRNHPRQILHRSIGSNSKPIGFARVWSRTKRDLSIGERRFISSVSTLIVPVLKRAALQAKFEYAARSNNAVEEFAVAVHENLELSEVVQAATSQITRGIRYDFFAFFVPNQSGSRMELQQLAGQSHSNIKVDEYRPMVEVTENPLSAHHAKIWAVEECEILRDHSPIAERLADSNLESVIIQSLRKDGEIVAQLWIGLRDLSSVSPDDVEFMSRVGHRLLPALENARSAESLQDLQRQLVGHNEQLVHMQDGIERTEGELRISNQRLADMSESKSQFLAEVAHEFKTPLTVIIGYANMLRSDESHLDEELSAYAGSIEKSASQLTTLIRDLGDISKIDSGQFTSTKTLHDISADVADIVEGIKISNLEYRDRLKCEGSDTANVIFGDSSRLGQVFTNLITNALKYSPVDQDVVIAIDISGEKLKISVADQGMGISEADISRLFTPYFRSSNPEALEREGTGLGLYLSKLIVEEHGGTITVSSQIGEGSTFSIGLPLAANNDQSKAA
jgi:signal transduction histidine kinase